MGVTAIGVVWLLLSSWSAFRAVDGPAGPGARDRGSSIVARRLVGTADSSGFQSVARIFVAAAGIAATGVALRGTLPRVTALRPVLVGCVVVLDPEGEGGLPFREARRRVLHDAPRPLVSAAHPGAGCCGVPCDGRNGRRDAPRPVLAFAVAFVWGFAACSPSGCRPGSSGRSPS